MKENKNDITNTENLYLTALKKFPLDSKLHNAYGEFFLRKGKIQEAEFEFQNAIKLNTLNLVLKQTEEMTKKLNEAYENLIK